MRKLLQVMAGAAVGGAEEFFMRLAPALSRASVDQRSSFENMRNADIGWKTPASR